MRAVGQGGIDGHVEEPNQPGLSTENAPDTEAAGRHTRSRGRPTVHSESHYGRHVTQSPDDPTSDESRDRGPRVLLWMTVIAIVAGVLAGAVGGAFRWLLVQANHFRLDVASWSHGLGSVGWLIPVALSAAAACLAGIIASRIPLAAGSGIQHVEAVQRGEAAPPPLRVLPARFAGGLLSIGLGGLVLGREGPTVHMGATLGAWCAKVARATTDEIRTMQSALAGAGLAVAFNAPIAGVMFCLEEITHTIKVRYVVWTMASVAVAVMTSRVILGDHADFHVAPIAEPAFSRLPIFAVFGLAVALVGVVYNRLILTFLTAFDALHRIPPLVKSSTIGALIGAALTVDATLVGGGDDLTQALLTGQQMTFVGVAVIVVVRFVAGPLSYAAGTPGGLFAPMLALGALLGMIAGHIVDQISPGVGTELMPALMLVGMATMFTSVVRAPLTGAILVMEMCASTAVAIPLLAASVTAVVIPQLLGSRPVYDLLRERMLGAGPTAGGAGGAGGAADDR